ncbi:MAG: hypothetical protein ABEH47_04885 [Haloferacaceae archaeon]
MTIDIAGAVKRGVRRTVASNGIVLVGVVYVLGVVSGLFGPRRPAGGPPGFPADAPVAPPQAVIPVSPVVAAVISFVFALASLVVAIGAIRIFLTDETERVPTDAFTRRLVPAFVNVFLGGIVFAVAVFVGFLLLVVPGIFLLVSLAFWTVFVVEEDVNFIEGFRRSWRLTKGRRLRLFLLGLVVFVVIFLVNVVFGLVGAVLGSVAAVLSVVVSQIGGAFTTVFTWATLAAAYDQLQGEESTEDDADADADDEWEYNP